MKACIAQLFYLQCLHISTSQQGNYQHQYTNETTHKAHCKRPMTPNNTAIMNIYARYFDNEIVVHNTDQLFDFLSSLQEINVDGNLVEEITNYINSDITYPKRYKVRPRVYFILIKTTANSLEEFKANNKNAATPQSESYPSPSPFRPKESRELVLNEYREGWYFGRITFQRVIIIPGTQKFQYRKTDFSAYVRATSGMDCYNRIIDHLKNRQDVDPRSQMSSAKGDKFYFEFVGAQPPVAAPQA